MFAEKCAWRAIYIYGGAGKYGSPLRFSIGIDPTFGPGAVLFGAIGWRKTCVGDRNGTWSWRFHLPFRKSPRWAKLDGRRHAH
jgi:hypothetical protein